MFIKPQLTSGIPIYVQLKEQIIHAIEKGSLKPGDQLPSVRTLSENLIINPNTVIKIYRELEMAGILEIRHGAGAFVGEKIINELKTEKIRQGTNSVKKVVEQLINIGLKTDEIRRIVESELQERERK
jgi:GntR family transcriptional regulator